MVKDIGHLCKYNRPKQSTPTLKKSILSSSAAYTVSASNLTGTSISSHLVNKDITKDQNRNNTSNTNNIHSCVTARKQKYSVQAMTPWNTTLPIAPVEFHKTKQLPLAGKEYLCFQINRISSHATQCVKSLILNKAIESILYIDKFEKQYVVIESIL